MRNRRRKDRGPGISDRTATRRRHSAHDSTRTGTQRKKNPRPRCSSEKRRPGGAGNLALDQSNVAGAWSLRGFLGREFHALTLAKQLEDGAANSAAMEEVLDATFIA